MFATLDYETTIKQNFKCAFVDVRSPGEYKKATIPGALNIPLFDDEQRALIGMLYKESGNEAATRKGIDLISIRLPFLFDKFSQIDEKKIAVFCAKGGYRSSSIGSLFHALGMPIVKINQGYKGYRRYIIDQLPEIVAGFQYVVLYGKTGTGKTKILYELQKLGADILDLEGCANHRGSLLGGVGLSSAHSQKTFESMIFHNLFKAKSKVIFIEGESKRIGKVFLPDCLYQALSNGEKVLITSSLKRRIAGIKEDYRVETGDKEEMSSALSSLAPYIGHKQTTDYITLLRDGQYDKLIGGLMKNYYDLAYSTNEKSFNYNCENTDEALCAGMLWKKYGTIV